MSLFLYIQILIHGSDEAIEHLREYCERNILKMFTSTTVQSNGEANTISQSQTTISNEISNVMLQSQKSPQKLIFTPNLNETVDLTSDINIWKVIYILLY
jgi:hypothetical protein